MTTSGASLAWLFFGGVQSVNPAATPQVPVIAALASRKPARIRVVFDDCGAILAASLADSGDVPIPGGPEHSGEFDIPVELIDTNLAQVLEQATVDRVRRRIVLRRR
jgi:hypothetical protein